MTHNLYICDVIGEDYGLAVVALMIEMMVLTYRESQLWDV